MARLPSDYKAYANINFKSNTSALPLHQDTNHAIELEQGIKPTFSPLNNLSEME
jgi:hypothetical protein